MIWNLLILNRNKHYWVYKNMILSFEFELLTEVFGSSRLTEMSYGTRQETRCEWSASILIFPSERNWNKT